MSDYVVLVIGVTGATPTRRAKHLAGELAWKVIHSQFTFMEHFDAYRATRMLP